MAVAERIREEREKRGWTQGDLSNHSGTNRDTISGVESGRHRPRPSTLRKIAGAFGLEVRDLFEDTTRPKVSQLDLESFLIEETGHAYLATLSRQELRNKARGDEGREFREACREELDAVRNERKQYPASAGDVPLFTTGDTHKDVLRRYNAVRFADWSEEEAALEEERVLAEAG